MLTSGIPHLFVTVPRRQLAADLAPLPDGVEVAVWDLTDPAPRDSIDIVVPPYMNGGRILVALNERAHPTDPGAVDRLRRDRRLRRHRARAFANASSVHEASTAELAVALTLAAQRHIPDFVRSHGGAARGSPCSPTSLADRRVLLLGYGGVGKAVAARLAPFEVSITAVASRARTEDGIAVHGVDELSALLPDADIVILSPAGGGDATRHIIDDATLSALPDGALVVNVRRADRSSTPTRWWATPPPAASARRSTSPIRSRCRRGTRCGRCPGAHRTARRRRVQRHAPPHRPPREEPDRTDAARRRAAAQRRDRVLRLRPGFPSGAEDGVDVADQRRAAQRLELREHEVPITTPPRRGTSSCAASSVRPSRARRRRAGPGFRVPCRRAPRSSPCRTPARVGDGCRGPRQLAGLPDRDQTHPGGDRDGACEQEATRLDCRRRRRTGRANGSIRASITARRPRSRRRAQG